MRIPFLPQTPLPHRGWVRRTTILLMAVILFLPEAAAAGAASGKEDFGSLVKLAPFVVNGRQLSVSVHARSSRDRRYAVGFAEEVVAVVCEAVTPETGRGLVIIGQKGEPHPIHVFRRFLTMAQAGQIDPAVAARAPELIAALDRWETTITEDDATDASDDDLEFEKIMTALPLALEGVGAQLYQLAWAERFDEAKVETRLRALRTTDLSADLFTPYDWVFYLPPRKAYEQVLDGLVADALKEDDAGFFARMAVKGVMLAVKPRIRQAIEAMRQGLLFATVVEARTQWDRSTVDELTDAYIEVLLPAAEGKRESAPGHEHAVKAVRDRLRELDSATAGSASFTTAE